MSTPNQKREFSIERRLRLATGGDYPNQLPFPEENDTSGVTNADVLNALNELREEIKNMGSTGIAAPETAVEEEQGDIRQEVACMIKSIGQAKAEIAAIKHPHSEEGRFDKASKQLDAIVEAAEAATHDILMAAEEIEKVVSEAADADPTNETISSLGNDIGGYVVQILEACSFQDITGQRVTKVVKTMSYIEERIRAVIDIWGMEAFEGYPHVPDTESDDEEGDLLAGPQFANEGISQDDIDSLFA